MRRLFSAQVHLPYMQDSVKGSYCKWEQDSQAFGEGSSPCFWISSHEFPFTLLSSDWKKKTPQIRTVFMLLDTEIFESHGPRSVSWGKNYNKEGERSWESGSLSLPWSCHAFLVSCGQHRLNFPWKRGKVHSLSFPLSSNWAGSPFQSVHTQREASVVILYALACGIYMKSIKWTAVAAVLMR